MLGSLVKIQWAQVVAVRVDISKQNDHSSRQSVVDSLRSNHRVNIHFYRNPGGGGGGGGVGDGHTYAVNLYQALSLKWEGLGTRLAVLTSPDPIDVKDQVCVCKHTPVRVI